MVCACWQDVREDAKMEGGRVQRGVGRVEGWTQKHTLQLCTHWLFMTIFKAVLNLSPSDPVAN